MSPRRPPRARVSPEALAAARGGAVEGLAWLGRTPEARASILYRLLRLVARFVLFVVFRFRIRTSGQANLPAGGYLLVGAAHRGWMDPFVVMHALPPAAACLVPRQRSVDLHLALAGVARPSRRRAVARLARRGRGGAARRIGPRRRRQRRRLRPDARGHRERAAGSPGRVPERLGDHRAAYRRPDRAVRAGRHRGALPRQADGIGGPAGDHGPRPGRTGAGRPAPRRGFARGTRGRPQDERRARVDPRAGRRTAPRDDRRSARASVAVSDAA